MGFKDFVKQTAAKGIAEVAKANEKMTQNAITKAQARASIPRSDIKVVVVRSTGQLRRAMKKYAAQGYTLVSEVKTGGVLGTGWTARLVFERRTLQATDSPMPTSAETTPAESIPDQIQKLAELRDTGILSNEEFEAKKTDLLSRM